MKFQRNLDAEIVKFDFLSEDYRKLVFLCDDRSIELHAQYGRHYKTRIPRFPRDMAYNPFNCELYIVGATSEVYRLSLDQGRFLAPLEAGYSSEFNVVALNPELKWVLGCGGDDGILECWDLRQREKIAAQRTGK